MTSSKYQLEVYRQIENPLGGNLVINATAGSGKTTTLLNCLDRVPRNRKSIFVSFSNTIVKELKERLPIHVKGTTLHSLGFSILRQTRRKIYLDEDKYFKIALYECYEGNRKRDKEIYKKCR